MEETREEARTATKGGKLSSWLKAAVGTVAGLLSGAAMMYISPLIDRVVKPAKPLANFAVEHEGTTVTFQNRSTGTHDGWWDFGDGAALEPVDPTQQTVTHTYAGPGDYTAKLTVNNLIGDENERVVSLHLDGSAPAQGPEIAALTVEPVSPGSYAPATFHITAQLKNAQICVWDLDDNRPMEVTKEAAATQERLVTFDRPGSWKLNLVAVNGTQTAQKSVDVKVQAPPSGSVAAVLNVTDAATRVETVSVPCVFSEPFPSAMKDAAAAFTRQVTARPGCLIKDVQIPVAKGPALQMQNQAEMAIDPALVRGGNVRNLKLQMAQDRRSVRLTGELMKPAALGKGGAVPNVELPVVLVEERRSAAQRPGTPVTATLTAPGSAMLMMPPLPADWVDAHRQMRLELRAGNQVVWQESGMPRGNVVTINNRRFLLTATPVNGQLRVDLIDARQAAAPAAN
jgi:PKD repeat protein